MNHSSIQRFGFRHKNGFALMLVFIMISLSLTVATLFLFSTSAERRGIGLYQQSSATRQLADTAVNLVIGQINTATKESTSSNPISWASQPGMIRTYQANGQLSHAYKLYSWDTPIEGSSFNPTYSNQLPPGDWKSKVAGFTNLNQPTNDVYPIVDPRAETSGKVSGFHIDASNAAIANSGQAAAMPVKWLYILKDGTYVSPTNISGNQATIPGATTSNPIIGRVAYWTDDETCKVNINTASEGAFWDVPRSGSRDDMQLAGNPPVKNEFSRIPGHPAKNSLSAVFPELRSGTTSRWASLTSYRNQLKSIYNMVPRIAWDNGGSQGGTYPVDSYSMNYEPVYGFFDSNPLPSTVTLDTDRLYTTPDEFWFQPTRSVSAALSAVIQTSDFRQRLFFLTANSRAPETTLFETPRISLWPITWPNASSYWYSAENNTSPSKRPGSPPTSQNPATTSVNNNNWTTVQDRLLAFCSTLNFNTANEYRYFFQRQNPDSPTYDWNNISRNQDLVGYLRRQMDKSVPGYGASLASKWGNKASDWIALNCFDFTRCNINQYTMESTPAITMAAGKNDLGYSYTGVSYRNAYINGSNIKIYTEANTYAASPLRVTFNSSKYVTAGGYPTLKEVALLFYTTSRSEPTPTVPVPSAAAATDATDPYYNPYNWQNLINPGIANGGTSNYPVGCQTIQMKAVMLLDFAGMERGAMKYSPLFWVRVYGGNFSINGNAINLPSTTGRSVEWTNLPANGINQINNFESALLTVSCSAKTFSATGTAGSCDPNVWSLTSNVINTNASDTTFAFTGTKIYVALYAPYSQTPHADPTNDNNQLISVQEVDFAKWNGTLPMPCAPRWNLRDGKMPFSATPSLTQSNALSYVNYNKPNPFYSATSSWALSEIVPEVANATTYGSVLSLSSDRTLKTAVTAGYPLVYTYKGSHSTGSTMTSSVPVSPVFENRVNALLLRRNGSTLNTNIFYAENCNVASTLTTISAGDVFSANIDEPYSDAHFLISPYDTVISMVPDPSSGSKGDARLTNAYLSLNSTSNNFIALKNVTIGNQSQPAAVLPLATAPRVTFQAQYHTLNSGEGLPLVTGYRNLVTFNGVTSGNYFSTQGQSTATSSGAMGADTGGGNIVGAEVGAAMNVSKTWDWTGMPGGFRDGAFLVRPDQDYQSLSRDPSDLNRLFVPYFQKYGLYGEAIDKSQTSDNYYCPNRQVASPVILGTLPSSMTTGWQTLAFSPNPAAGASHPGLASPPDHLLLDFFWMPVAEPYPISSQLSTDGKINLNYAIMPFSYIQRKTGLHSLLKASWLTAIPDSASAYYKSHFQMRNQSVTTRYDIDIDNTLKAFDTKFNSGDIFRSASQICEQYLYPADLSNGNGLLSYNTSNSAITSWWNGMGMTSDNAREAPYNDIYSRITTKSNNYTVHWRSQSLRKAPGSDPTLWNENQDVIVGDLRGSTLIERYLDPNATNIPDYATDTTGNATPLSRFYKWRTVTETYFHP